MLLEMEDGDDEGFGLFQSAEPIQKVNSNSIFDITSLSLSSIATDDNDDDWGNFIGCDKPPPTVFSSATPSREWESALPAILSLYGPMKPNLNVNQWGNCIGVSPLSNSSEAQTQDEGTRIGEEGVELFGSSKSFNHVNKIPNPNVPPSLNAKGNSRETTIPGESGSHLDLDMIESDVILKPLDLQYHEKLNDDGDAKSYGKSISSNDTDKRMNVEAKNMIFTDLHEQRGVGDVLISDLHGGSDEIGSNFKWDPLVLGSWESLCSNSGHFNNKQEELAVSSNMIDLNCDLQEKLTSDTMNMEVTESICTWKSTKNYLLNMGMTNLDLACNPSKEGLKSSLGALNVDHDALNSSVEIANSHVNGCQEELYDDFDGCEFQCAETKDDSIVDIFKENRRNILSNVIQNGVQPHASVSLMNLDATRVNGNSFAENEDFVDEQEWEFKVASSQSSGRDALLEGGSGSHCKNCLFGLSEGSSHKSCDPDSDFMINAASFINSRANGKPVGEGNNTELENPVALPLSFFGEEEREYDDDLSICQEFSNQFSVSNSNPADAPMICSDASFGDLISSLYDQSYQNGTAMASDLETSAGDLDDDSWEFMAASVGSGAEDHSVFSARSKQTDLVDFFFNLKEELHFVVLRRLETLERARSDATLAGEVDDARTFHQEIVELRDELRQDGLFHGEEDPPKKLNYGGASISEFIRSLQESYLQLFDSEYQISAKLLSGENDWRLEIEALRSVALVLKILTLAPAEDQRGYVWVWSKMLSLCEHELDHGALIWNRSSKENIRVQLLSNPRGRNYIIALGEIYRIVEVIAASVRLFKPWILACAEDPVGLISLVSLCSATWADSGLEETLGNISDLDALENGVGVRFLLESIKRVRDLDVLHIHNCVFSPREPVCRFSLLNTVVVPGMKTVEWNGNQYFLTLANFWANLVSEDPPNLPPLDLR